MKKRYLKKFRELEHFSRSRQYRLLTYATKITKKEIIEISINCDIYTSWIDMFAIADDLCIIVFFKKFHLFQIQAHVIMLNNEAVCERMKSLT